VSGRGHLGRRFDLEYVLDVLLKARHIDPRLAIDIRDRADAQRVVVQRDRDRADQRAGIPVHQISPVELIASLEQESLAGVPLDEDRIMESVAADANLPYRKIDPTRLDLKWVTQILSRPFARKHIVLPLHKRGDELDVAIENPFDFELLETLHNLTRATVRPVLSARADILRLITEIYGFRSSIQSAEEDATSPIAAAVGAVDTLGNLEQFFHLKAVDEIEANDKHVINAIDYLLHYALDQRASDIHIEPKRDASLVRLRIDGILHETHRIPRAVQPAFVTRIKTMARLDIAEKRRPQDGRIKVTDQGKEVELRVSTMAVAFGEKAVLRILDPAVLLRDMGELGFYADQLEGFRGFMAEPNGLIIVCGPTGSGKTTTLYSALHELARPEVNVITIEDPIEMVIETFNQTAVQPRIDLTFANQVRTTLRQDPDILLVGEVRDPETAHQAIQAALTGHLVLTTLHTRDTAGAITRLLDLGVEPFLVASTLLGCVAQRLVRTICDRCGADAHLDQDQCGALDIPPEQAGQLAVRRGEGCTHCRDTGYKGRSGVYEVMPVDEAVRGLIRDRADAPLIHRAARRAGMLTLRESAIRKLADGVTAFEEVVRVTSDIEAR
jgi:general secretion pathway protein E